MPTGPPVNGTLLPVAVFNGQATHVAANGDELHSAYEGTGTVNLLTGHVDFDLSGMLRGRQRSLHGSLGRHPHRGFRRGRSGPRPEEGSITY